MVLTSHRVDDVSSPLAGRWYHEEGRDPLLHGWQYFLQESRGEHSEAAGESEEAERGKRWTDRESEEAVVSLGHDAEQSRPRGSRIIWVGRLHGVENGRAEGSRKDLLFSLRRVIKADFPR